MDIEALINKSKKDREKLKKAKNMYYQKIGRSVDKNVDCTINDFVAFEAYIKRFKVAIENTQKSKISGDK